MKTVFADTGYWIALINPDDALHIRTHQLTNQLLPFNIVTTELVLNELMNAFSKKNAQLKQAAIHLIHSLLEDPTVEVIPQTSQLFTQAFTLYSQRVDQAWSHTDCTSFCIMKDRQIMDALAYDQHFNQAGFIALLRKR